MHEFPTIEEVLAIHEIIVREFGGPQELRDTAALESALLRSQFGYYKDLLEEAAALMESLAMKHLFVDGNKRTAFYTTDAFLRINGRFIDCDNQEAYEFFMHLFETYSFRFGQVARVAGTACQAADVVEGLQNDHASNRPPGRPRDQNRRRIDRG